MRTLGSLVVLVAVLSTPAAGRDIYVSNIAGDDGFTGEQSRNTADRTGPVRTIAKALRLATGGDRVVLLSSDEPYRESISLVGLRHSGQSGRAFRIEGNGAILDGSAPVPPSVWEHQAGGVFRFRPPRSAHQQLFLDDLPLERIHATGPSRPSGLEPLQWCLHQGYIYFRVEKGKLPIDYNLSYARMTTGITLYHVEDVAIVGLTVQGFQLDGINAFNSARGVDLSDVNCRGNGRSGIAVGGASTVQIDLSVVGNNGTAQLLTLPHSQTAIRNSSVFSNTAPAWVDRGGRFYRNGQRATGGIDGEDITPADEVRGD